MPLLPVKDFSMARFEITRTVDASPDRVFEVFTDLKLWSRCSDIVKVEQTTPGPIQQGTKIEETRKVSGREATAVLEFTEFQPPNRWAIAGESLGSRCTTSFDLQPEGDGTRVIVNTRLKALNPLTWCLGLLAPLMMGVLKRTMNRDLDTLASIADGTWTEELDQVEQDPEPGPS